MPNPIVTGFPPGIAPEVWRPGDFIATRNLHPWHTRQGFLSAAIRAGEWIRFHSEISRWPKPWRVNHVACVGDGHLIEALGGGVQHSPLDKYRPIEFIYVATDLDASERFDCVEYWESMVGTKYGYLGCGATGFQLATGLHIGLSNTRHVICSGLATAGLGIYQYRSNPSMVSPTELLLYHDIRAGTVRNANHPSYLPREP